MRQALPLRKHPIALLERLDRRSRNSPSPRLDVLVLVFLRTLDNRILRFNQMLHILPDHEPPLLRWNGCDALLHRTRDRVR